jgi:hypothetical protein
MLYSYGAVPPVAVAVTVATPFTTTLAVAVTVMAAGAALTVTADKTPVQPFASFTVIVYTPAVRPTNTLLLTYAPPLML